jgi:isoquinoline 1-oxidoreductase beta subunit
MSKIGKIARRGFLVGSAAIAGGVAFGAYMVARDPENPLIKGASPDDAIFNPWIKINAQGITLIAPHADVGQGAASVQAALIAEELDLDPGQFDLSFGRPSPA